MIKKTLFALSATILLATSWSYAQPVVQNGNSDGHYLFGNTSVYNGCYAFLRPNGTGSQYNDGAFTLVAGDANTSGVGLEYLQYRNNGGNGFYTSYFSIWKNGRIGMGGVTPISTGDHSVTIKGGINITSPSPTNDDNWGRGVSGVTDAGTLGIFTNSNSQDGSYIQMHGRNRGSAGARGLIQFVANAWHPDDLDEKAFAFTTYDGGEYWVDRMLMKKDGRVLIGHNIISNNNAPAGYKLYVQDGILTEKVKVALSIDNVNWSDFVFADDYKLKSLADVEEFIKTNKHLPDIPSAETVYKEGIDLAQMDAKLLQKIEELTLYVIKLEKEVKQLKKSKISH